MSLFITSLNSGSNGNCYYVGNDKEAVLIDAGISCKETERRMQRLGLSMETVKAVFVSHEHSDHITGLVGLTRKYSIPVYITPATLQKARLPLNDELVRFFTAHEPVSLGALSITAFPKFHDAVDPHSFIIRYQEVTVGVFTDIGQSCEHLAHYFRQCNAIFLEANYEESMLQEGRYPAFLKNRISGGQGHLSNAQALELFITHRRADLTHLLLAHLSKDNNCPQRAMELFRPHCERTELVIASRYEATPVYSIEEAGLSSEGVCPRLGSGQLSMFI